MAMLKIIAPLLIASEMSSSDIIIDGALARSPAIENRTGTPSSGQVNQISGLHILKCGELVDLNTRCPRSILNRNKRAP